MCVCGGGQNYLEIVPILAVAGHLIRLHNGPVLLLIWWTGQSKATQLGAGGAGIPICAPLATE